jgi:hypothetical protein
VIANSAAMPRNVAASIATTPRIPATPRTSPPSGAPTSRATFWSMPIAWLTTMSSPVGTSPAAVFVRHGPIAVASADSTTTTA